MTTTTRKHRTEQDRKEQILAAARAVFGEKGYENTTVSNIVRRAGVAQGTFYLYFASKREAVIALGARPMEEMAIRMEAAGANGLSFEEMLREMVRVAFEIERTDVDLCRLMSHAKSLSANLLDAMPTYQRIGATMRSMFESAVASGEMHPMDPEMANEMMHLIISGAMSAAADKRDDDYTKRMEEATAQVLVNAFVRR
jgi:AcrR family transcriptional regulator